MKARSAIALARPLTFIGDRRFLKFDDSYPHNAQPNAGPLSHHRARKAGEAERPLPLFFFGDGDAADGEWRNRPWRRVEFGFSEEGGEASDTGKQGKGKRGRENLSTLVSRAGRKSDRARG